MHKEAKHENRASIQKVLQLWKDRGGKARHCSGCESACQTWTVVVDVAAAGSPHQQNKKGGFVTRRKQSPL